MTVANERVLTYGHLLLEGDDLMDDGDVLRGERLHRFDPVDEIVDARRAEEHGDGRLVVARRVDVDEPRREILLRDDEVRLRGVQADPVDREVVVDRVQPRVRRVVPIACALEARIEYLNLFEDALRLGLFRADRGVGGRCTCCDSCCSKGDDDDRSLSLQCLDDVSRLHTGASAPGLLTSQGPDATRGYGCWQPVNAAKAAANWPFRHRRFQEISLHKLDEGPGKPVLRSGPT